MYFLFLNLLDVVVSFVVGNIVDAAKVEKEYIIHNTEYNRKSLIKLRSGIVSYYIGSHSRELDVQQTPNVLAESISY